MSLLLCRQEPVETPYVFEELGIRLYSSQELCYVIYHHPLLVMEGFLNERLTAFLRTELRLPFLAERIERQMDSRSSSDELLFQILSDCAYYTPQEQTKFRQEVTTLRKLSAEEFEKRRADYFYKLGLFGKAVAMYERILDKGREKSYSKEFKGKIWNNIAACYTKLFCYQKAMHAYDCAWNEDEKQEYLKRMYFLCAMNPELSVKDRYLEMMTDEVRTAWDEELAAIRSVGSETDSAKEINELFEKDPVKRLAGASDMINRWKVEYRRMI